MLYGIGEAYSTIAVANLGKQDAGYDADEQVDQGKENVRTAVASKSFSHKYFFFFQLLGHLYRKTGSNVIHFILSRLGSMDIYIMFFILWGDKTDYIYIYIYLANGFFTQHVSI